MSNTTIIVIGMIVPLLLSGFANFYAHKSWILYLPLAGILLLIGYLGHLAIRSANAPRSEQATTPIPSITPAPLAQTQRPYVTLHHAVAHLENINGSENSTLVELVFENSGKEPAYNVRAPASAFIAFQKLFATPDQPLPTSPATGGSFLGADRQMTVILGTPGTADPELKGKIERGEVFLYVYGVVNYLNRSDNKTHTSEFCGLYVPERKGFDQTLFGNDVD